MHFWNGDRLGNRNRYDLIYCIIKVCLEKGFANEYAIMQGIKATSYVQSAKYILVCLEKGFIEKSLFNGKRRYRATHKGLKYLKGYENLIRIMGECMYVMGA